MDEIDRILSSEPLVEPSPEFAGRVVAAVRREAGLPPPIAFPWRRAATAAAVMATAGAVLAAVPELREPAQRAAASLVEIGDSVAGASLGGLALSAAILLATLWAYWRAD